MKSCYVREQRRYTLSELCKLFQTEKDRIDSLIYRLKAAGVLKTVEANDRQKFLNELAEEDITVSDDEGTDALYVFTYVGVVIAENRVIKCYPKYLPNDIAPVAETRQAVRVLEVYKRRYPEIQLSSEEQLGKGFNLVALMIALLRDYHEYGLYTREQNIIELNGNGNIIWNRTIDESFAVISRGRPFYTELRTAKRISDDYDYFKRLHACVLTDISKEFEKAELTQLFDVETAEISDELIDDFGDQSYISYRIERELNVVFSTRKQHLLKMLYSYINRKGGLMDEDSFTLYGTNSFNLVWEDVCACVLNNQLHKKINDIDLPVPLKPQYRGNRTLIELIEKPVWSGDGYSEEASDTLIPDIVTVCKRDGMWSMMIFDAKYYLIEAGKGILRGNPGIESVTKQYLYQLAYQRFTEAHEIRNVENYFLMPTAEKSVIDVGIVSMPMMKALGLADIRVLKLPVDQMYRMYISGLKTDIRDL